MQNVNVYGLMVSGVLLGCQPVQAAVDPLDPVFSVDRLAECSRFWRKPVVYDYVDREGNKKTGGELNMPGFFDVGAGYFQIHNADGQGQDAHGVMVLAKAYPLRRYYSTRAEPVLQPQKEQALQTAVATLNQTKQQDGTSKTATEKTALDGLHSALNTLNQESKRVYSICYPDRQLKTVIGKAFDKITPERRVLSRVYTYLGVSLDESGSAKINDNVKAVGLGVDITPEFSFNVGYAMYQTDVNGQADSRESVVYGVSLNLAAFSVFREAVKLE